MEEYVTREIAELLRELDFDGFCMAYYREETEELHLCSEKMDKKSMEDREYKYNSTHQYKLRLYLAPTQQMAKAWLREVHQIYIRDDYRIFETEKISYRDYYIEAKNMKNNNLLYYGAFDDLSFGVNRVIKYMLERIKERRDKIKRKDILIFRL